METGVPLSAGHLNACYWVGKVQVAEAGECRSPLARVPSVDRREWLAVRAWLPHAGEGGGPKPQGLPAVGTRAQGVMLPSEYPAT